MKDIKEFERKVTVITGGAHGIGKATADAFRKEGAVVYIIDSTPGTIAEGCSEVIRMLPYIILAPMVSRCICLKFLKPESILTAEL